ncbi:MAG: tRNA epoxyqueuosine(34) reductase QueG [Anaerolineaceae bacterium]|nr:tRNA epoxyqueuosine(34) reductase QueG [Anaerolineaceae bacterium]MCY3935268.1 tRNA epoxyqueuosine(34) reductase QueG [Chloroflexota bacterium]
MKASHSLWKESALRAGFNLVGITTAEPSPNLQAYIHWLNAHMYGEMQYLARNDRIQRRMDLNQILSGVRSLVVVGMDYAWASRSHRWSAELRNPARGRIAAYAWGADYHAVMQERLKRLTAELTGIAARRRSQDWKVYVDTGALLERSHGQLAGLGFIGKNTMLIHPRKGGNFFLGVILTTLEFDEYDPPAPVSMCGSCQRCLQACPTQAFPEPYVLDARLCISYLTIEHKGWLPRELREKMGNWIFGCDVCQEVCPFQRFASSEAETVFQAEMLDRAAPRLLDLLSLSEEEFRSRYQGTVLWRLGYPRLLRNAIIAAGNWGDHLALTPLERLLDSDWPIVRGHAAWALVRILGENVHSLLRRRLANEGDGEVRREIRQLFRAGTHQFTA